jgi:hypothetical protein
MHINLGMNSVGKNFYRISTFIHLNQTDCCFITSQSAFAPFAIAFWARGNGIRGRAAAANTCALVVDGLVYDGASVQAAPWWAALDGALLVALWGGEEARAAARAYCALHGGASVTCADGRASTRVCAHVHARNPVDVVSSALVAARVLGAPEPTAALVYTALALASARLRVRSVYTTTAVWPPFAAPVGGANVGVKV